MKLNWLLLLILLLALVVPAYAQDADPGTSLPPTAAEGVNVLALWLAALSGLAANALVNALKKMTWIPEKDRSSISGPLADLTAVLISVLSGWLVGLLGQWAGQLDQSGVWQVIGFSWPWAKTWFEGSEARRAIAGLVSKWRLDRGLL